MGKVELFKNLYCWSPSCCEFSFGEGLFNKKIKEAIDTIKTTSIGRQLFQDIANGFYPIEVTTHDLSKRCLNDSKMVLTRAVDRKASVDLTRGTGSIIFIHPYIFDHKPKYFTLHHYKRCVARGLVSRQCGNDGNNCNRLADFVRIVFHELVHAKNNQQGNNLREHPSLLPVDKNKEEMETIKLENLFVMELLEKGQLKEKPNDEKSSKVLDIDLYMRYGHQSPDHPKQKEMLKNALDPVSVDYLVNKIPRMIADFGKFYDALVNPHRNDFSEQSVEDYEDLYKM